VTLTDPELTALWLSLKVAGVAAAVALPLAIWVAWILSRKRFFGKWLVEGVIHLPLVLPPVVVGYLLLMAFGRNGWIGGFLRESFGISIAFTWVAAAIAAGVMGFPLMVRAIRLAFDAIDTGIENAARTLGASKRRVFFTIALPLAAPGVVAGSILGFARGLGEFGATIAFAANIPGETRTLPLAIYTALQAPDGEDTAFRLAVISAVVALFAVALSEWLNARTRRQMTGRDS
jgi:molybdate transport system permease protein